MKLLGKDKVATVLTILQRHPKNNLQSLLTAVPVISCNQKVRSESIGPLRQMHSREMSRRCPNGKKNEGPRTTSDSYHEYYYRPDLDWPVRGGQLFPSLMTQLCVANTSNYFS